MVFLAISTAVATIIASIIAGVVSFFGVRSTNQQNVANTQATNDLQRQLAGQANNWQEQMWERQNAYNDPSSQVARLAGANLNPAMIMSQGGIMNEAGDVGSAHMPVMSVPQVQNPIDPATASQIALNMAQARRLDTQNEVDWGNLSEAQKRTLILQQNADSVALEAKAKFDDVQNMIMNRDKRFELDKDMQQFTQNVTKEQLSQTWSQIHISEENLKMQLELLPFMKREYAERANMYAKQAALAQKETEIAEINRQYQEMLQGIRKEFESEYKAYITGGWQAGAAQSSLVSAQTIEQRLLVEKPFLYWCYQLFTGGAVGSAASSSLSAAQIVKLLATK